MPTANQAKPDPCLVVIFGASGDLTERKLVPALYDLLASRQLNERFAIMGVSRTSMSDDEFRRHLYPSVKEHAHHFDEQVWREFSAHLHYHAGDASKDEAYDALKARMCQLAQEHQTGQNAIFYLAVMPQLYEPIIQRLGRHNLVTEGKAWCSLDREHRAWQRIVVEKPIGFDVESGAELNRALGRVFEEEAIYRIDHYLGKDIVQNVLVFRFANTIFEPVWNRNYIDHVQVTAAESVGVEGRGAYYDSPAGGALRDMIQSHLLQVMSLVAMEPPVSMRADDVRSEKNKVLVAARCSRSDEIPLRAVRGQYGPGQIDGKALPGYRQEKGVSPDSVTETYAALQVLVDTWRWEGVPFYLRSGKRMAKKLTQIVVVFKPTPHCLFREAASGPECRPPNQIVISVQPDEGIRLRFEGKVPGSAPGVKIKSVVMDFDYIAQFKVQPPEAYATLLLEVMLGDQTLFKHRDEVDHAWRIVQPVLDYWKEYPPEEFPNYAAGSWGPSEADVMMAREGRHWYNP